MQLSPQQLHILQHSLGLDQYGQGSQYRNRFVTGPGTSDYPICQSLVESGHMTVRKGSELTGGDDNFMVTRSGITAVAEQSPKPPPAPKLTRSQRRYRDFIKADTGLSFGEWLQDQPRRQMA